MQGVEINVVGLVIVSHGRLAESLLEAAFMILGEQRQVKAVGLQVGEGLSDMQQKIQEAIQCVDEGDGFIIFADLQGGTPGNAACLLAGLSGFHLVTGVNLAMLLEVFTARAGASAQELVDIAINAGRASIQDLGSEVKSRLQTSPTLGTP
ncbi:MAG: PTS sugar transporter subunit IIA [Candidatus Fermentithermobacillus carboniphilus]|uniref:PTS sugar transporter subunit IIA n=1 Tax=Candidatus Fermentithermobacillus carboniphilus TaxID=3085328 RepID=A0AAT9LE70_9FIRM|nr:MAG: PTS sugar transporter subunit IIA [Candidatus Fermentithermobacillus carboniphilus]